LSTRVGNAITRRGFSAGLLALLAWPRTARPGTAAPPTPGLVRPDGSVPPAMEEALGASVHAYISPLRSDGRASTCHGEVWFAWLDGTVLTTTSQKSWKARAAGRGLDRARLWFGNYGRWKFPGGKNEAFRRGLNFEARVRVEKDAAVLERILSVYERKYPEEIGHWRDRMRRELAAGERVILRYKPEPSPPAADPSPQTDPS
jgi:hypothetical protein